MTIGKRAGGIARLLSGGGALFAGLFLLATAPLTGVLIVLGATNFTLISAARLLGTEIQRW